jgi:hypothetical protein
VWREGQGGGWRIFEKKKRGRKKKVSRGTRENKRRRRARDKQTKKNRSPDLSVFSRHQPSFLREKKEKKGMR